MGLCYSYSPELLDHKIDSLHDDIILTRTQIRHINMALDILNRDLLKYAERTPFHSMQNLFWDGDNETGESLIFLIIFCLTVISEKEKC